MHSYECSLALKELTSSLGSESKTLKVSRGSSKNKVMEFQIGDTCLILFRVGFKFISESNLKSAYWFVTLRKLQT